MSSDYHTGAIAQEIPQPSVIKIGWRNTYITFKSPDANELTHWGRTTHICVGNLTIIGSDNGLSPDRRQAIIWTNDGILSIGPLGKNFCEILIGFQTFSLKKMKFKMSSAKWRPFCLGLNVLKISTVRWDLWWKHYSMNQAPQQRMATSLQWRHMIAIASQITPTDFSTVFPTTS